MIVHMNKTSSAAVGLRLEKLRETSGSVALGRVLTLIIVATDEAGVRDGIQAAAGASRAHPLRVVVVLPVNDEDPKLDAEIRVGPEAGLSEIAILRAHNGSATNLETLVSPLILPDTPIVTWWIQEAPAPAATTDVGAISQRRITTALQTGDPVAALAHLRDGYHPGDTDMGWAGITLWRNNLAAMLDEPPCDDVESAVVRGSLQHTSTYLLAGWLALRLGVPVKVEGTRGEAVDGVTLNRASGPIALDRPLGSGFGDMTRPGRATQRVHLPMRSLDTMLIEELREVTADTAYEDVLLNGLSLLDVEGLTK
ncbi:glucose-6-phosphate dehydrogenase assembly protein OpcA [Arcanobacterium haemolyticum]|nr:glucose-6-phosphate dehydrogenase assembly protein OpcA [Arcanobacterium haemolyticum]